MVTEDDLGPLARTYRTDDRERRKRALILVAVGLVIAPPGIVWATVEGIGSRGSETMAKGATAPTFIAFIGVIVLVLGAILFAGYWFNRDEKFHMYENCLVHETVEEVVAVRWSDIETIAPQPGSLTHWGLGGDTGFRLRLISGQTIYVTGFTESASELRGKLETRIRS